MKRVLPQILFAIMLSLALLMNTVIANASADEVNSLAQIVKEIQYDKPLPAVGYLQSAPAWNSGEQRYTGKYGNWIITVIVSDSSNTVRYIHLKKPGADNLEELLPPLVEKYGQARYSESAPDAIKSRSYGWMTGEARNTSLWYQFNTIFFSDSSL